MWRGSESSPFHTEVGYWLWDGATGEILRAFAVPRGIVVLAGGTADADAETFSLTAAADDPQYTIGENKYLAANASTSSYGLTVSFNDDGSWTYHEITMLDMVEFDEPFPHVDHNTLFRTGRGDTA